MPSTAEPVYYYVVRRPGLETEGPYTAAELATLVRHGVVNGQSLYCQAGGEVWLPVDAKLRAELGGSGRQRLGLLLLAAGVILAGALVFLHERGDFSRVSPGPPPQPEPSLTPTSRATPTPMPTATPPSATPRPTPALPATPYFSAARALVGTIQVYDRPDHVAFTHSGCLVSADGWFATGSINLLEGYHFVITLADGSRHEPEAVLYSPETGGVTLLKISGTYGPAAERPANEPLEVGEKLAVLARSATGAPLVLPGEVVSLAPAPGKDHTRLSVPLSQELAGAPVVDRQGRLLGLAAERTADHAWFTVLTPFQDVTAIQHAAQYCQLSWTDYLAFLKERAETLKHVVGLIQSGPAVEAERQKAIAQALARFPDDFPLFQEFTRAYAATGDRSGYEKLVQRWKDGHPDDYRLIVDRTAMLDLTNDQADQAPLYRQLIEIAPDQASYWEGLTKALRKIDPNSQEAAKAEMIGHALSSNEPAELAACGGTALESNNYPLAIACLLRAGDLGYGTPKVWKQLFTAYSLNKQNAAAATVAERYLRLVPGDADMWEQAALAWSRADRFDRADQCLDTALTLQPREAGRYEATRELIRTQRSQAARPAPNR